MIQGGGRDNYKKLYALISYLGVFAFCTCCILICLVCIVAVLSCLVCHCCWLAFVLLQLCVLLSSYVYLLYYVCIAVFQFRCRTAGQKSVFGRSCDLPSRHRFFLVSLCLKANAEMVPKIPSCHYMLLMQPSRLKFSSNQFHVLYTCKITTATG